MKTIYDSQIPGALVVRPAVITDRANDVVPSVRHVGFRVLAVPVGFNAGNANVLQVSRFTRTFWHWPFQRVSLHMKMEAWARIVTSPRVSMELSIGAAVAERILKARAATMDLKETMMIDRGSWAYERCRSRLGGCWAGNENLRLMVV